MKNRTRNSKNVYANTRILLSTLERVFTYVEAILAQKDRQFAFRACQKVHTRACRAAGTTFTEDDLRLVFGCHDKLSGVSKYSCFASHECSTEETTLTVRSLVDGGFRARVSYPLVELPIRQCISKDADRITTRALEGS